MPQITIELPVCESRHEFNRNRWKEILRDPFLADFPGKIETNRHGQVLMMPPASGSHSIRQSRIMKTLMQRMEGETLGECPVSTANGVRAADVGWYTEDRFTKIATQTVFEIAPEICVEVVSPSNATGEMEEKKTLYFDAGAEEVWFCNEAGEMSFFKREKPDEPMKQSKICPDFPAKIG